MTPALCVRCGRRPQDHGTFLCAKCLADPKTRAEQLKAERARASFEDQRRVLIEKMHWAGGWPKWQR